MKPNHPRRRLTRHLLTTAAFVATAGAFAGTASAKPNVVRKGGQWGILLGGSACIPGKAECKRESAGDVTVDGKTRPSFGLGAELGYRINQYVFVGAAYNLGFFDTDYEVTGASGYKRGFQNSVFGVVRPTLPVWRFDFGLGLAPGFSRQTFVRESGGDRDYSQGFAFKLAPAIDIWVAQRVFLGAKMDLILNAHRKTCIQTGNQTTCEDTSNNDLAPVHQMIFGLHVGGTFL